MLIIGFSPKTSKFWPNILCRYFKHCAPISVQTDGTMIMHQFVRYGHIATITLCTRDLKILGLYGWHFIYLPCDISKNNNMKYARTCVDLTKRAIGINSPVFTPYGLYKKLAPGRVF